MLGTVIALAAEPKEEHGAAAGGETTTSAAPAPPTPTTSKPPPAPAGDAAAGKVLFNAQGCSACHTFKPAGATAKVGPDLDNLAADAAKANRGTTEEYAAESIKDPSAYVVPGYPNGVMPAFTSLSDKQVGDLVAFLVSGSKG
jgi:mono/diheme cytochrome c family protein